MAITFIWRFYQCPQRVKNQFTHAYSLFQPPLAEMAWEETYMLEPKSGIFHVPSPQGC